MMTVAIEKPEKTKAVEPAAPAKGARKVSRPMMIGAILVVWLVLFAVLRGEQTLPLAAADLTDLHRRINDFNDSIGANRNSNPLFLYFFNEIRLVIDNLVTFIQHLISQPSGARPVPQVGWLGVVGIAGYVSWAVGNWRVALLAVAGFTFFGLQGLWQHGHPRPHPLRGVRGPAVRDPARGVGRALGPVQPDHDALPGLHADDADLRLPGTADPVLPHRRSVATIATVIYAAPPTIRITAHAIRNVSKTTVEAADSLGATRRQSLLKVLLPMSRRATDRGDAGSKPDHHGRPGHGDHRRPGSMRRPRRERHPGTAVPRRRHGLQRGSRHRGHGDRPGPGHDRGQRPRGERAALQEHLRAVAAATAGRRRSGHGGPDLPVAHLSVGGRLPGDGTIGSHIASAADTATNWAQDNLSGLTNAIRDAITNGLLNPFQTLRPDSPWWLVGVVLVALGVVFGGWKAGVTTAVCVGLLVGTGVWSDGMTTLASTLVATVLVMVLGIVFGVWMGRSVLVDRLIRPTLDAAQVMPPFVYLVPFLALFGATRFTAIVAAIVYGAPVTMKIIADGIRAVPETTVEAATSAGCNTWQIITKVQLPMSRSALTLATNQGLIYVL